MMRSDQLPKVEHTEGSPTSRSGQSTLEWICLVVVFLGVMISMRTYLVSLVAGRWRQVADQFGHGRQYEPCTAQTSTCTTISP